MSLAIFCKGFLRELQAEGYEVIAAAARDDYFDEFARTEGVPVVEVKMSRQISLLSDIRSLWVLYRLFRKERPDMVHSMTPKAGLLSMIAACMAGVPIRIHTFTGLVWPTASGVKRLILKTTDRITCLCATHIVPEGEGVKRDMIAGKITRKPLRVLGYGNVRGVDMEHYKPSRPKDKKSGDGTTFLFVGRLVKDKGVEELIDVWTKACGESTTHSLHTYDNVPISSARCTDKNLELGDGKNRLILVGPKEEQDKLSAITEQLIDTREDIEWVGYQADVRPWMERADVLVLPSHREGFPNVLLEAGAMEMPCVSTAVNGADEILTAATGIVVKIGDKEALLQAMKWMADNPEKREAMGGNARKRVEERWSQNYVRKCLKDYYKERLVKMNKK